jgi:hypothetical protein
MVCPICGRMPLRTNGQNAAHERVRHPTLTRSGASGFTGLGESDGNHAEMKFVPEGCQPPAGWLSRRYAGAGRI